VIGGMHMSIQMAIDEFNTNNSYKYKYELGNFLAYMRNVRNWDSDDTIFNGLLTKDIIESLDYVIGFAAYTAKSIAKKYVVALSELFLYLIRMGYIKNTDFYNELVAKRFDQHSYYNRLNAHIADDKRLKDPESNRIFTEDDINILLDECNSLFESRGMSLGIADMAKCLCIKLMILTGIKYNVAHKLAFNSYMDGCVTIGGYKFRLPIKFDRQFSVYFDKLKLELGYFPEFLFVKKDGVPWGEKTSQSPITYAVKVALGSTSTLGISKYGILKLIEVDVSDAVITEITGAQEDIISDCVRCRSEFDKEKYINSRICRNDLYYSL